MFFSWKTSTALQFWVDDVVIDVSITSREKLWNCSPMKRTCFFLLHHHPCHTRPNINNINWKLRVYSDHTTRTSAGSSLEIVLWFMEPLYYSNWESRGLYSRTKNPWNGLMKIRDENVSRWTVLPLYMHFVFFISYFSCAIAQNELKSSKPLCCKN